jgi:hypothetical protein
LIAKTQPVPAVAMSRLAAAGPISRVDWNTAAFRAMAARSWPGGTTSATNACRAGASKAKISPLAKANAYTSTARTAPAMMIAASAAVATAFRVCVVSRMRRFGSRSATPPACRPSTPIGRNCRAIVRPTQAELWVSSKISQSWAMLCIHVPVLARLWPPRYSR